MISSNRVGNSTIEKEAESLSKVFADTKIVEKKLRFASMAVAEMSVQYLLAPQLKYLSKKGLQIEALSARRSTEDHTEGRFFHRKISIEREVSPWRDLRSLWNLIRLFRREKYSIVNTHTPKAGILGPAAAQIAGVPAVVHTVHGFLFHDQMPAKRRLFFWIVEKFTAFFSDYLFFQSREDFEWALKKKFISPQKAFHIGNGIDIQKFNPDRPDLPDREMERSRLGIPNDAIVIGTVGRLVYEKGFREYFEVVKQLRAWNPKLFFLIVGGEEKDQNDSVSKTEIKELSRGGNVLFLGARSDVDVLYKVMDIFVLLSHREGLPRALMEAQAMRLPAVVTDIRGCREVVSHGLNGYLVTIKDIEEAILRIQVLVANSRLRERMGERARKKILEGFNEDFVHERIENALKKISQDRRLKDIRWN